MPEPARPLGTDDADDLRLYLEAAAREPLLTKEEEVELAMTIEATVSERISAIASPTWRTRSPRHRSGGRTTGCPGRLPAEGYDSPCFAKRGDAGVFL